MTQKLGSHSPCIPFPGGRARRLNRGRARVRRIGDTALFSVVRARSGQHTRQSKIDGSIIFLANLNWGGARHHQSKILLYHTILIIGKSVEPAHARIDRLGKASIVALDSGLLALKLSSRSRCITSPGSNCCSHFNLYLLLPDHLIVYIYLLALATSISYCTS